jgi:hypothetical protein
MRNCTSNCCNKFRNCRISYGPHTTVKKGVKGIHRSESSKNPCPNPTLSIDELSVQLTRPMLKRQKAHCSTEEAYVSLNMLLELDEEAK